jgi:hypothetical protein
MTISDPRFLSLRQKALTDGAVEQYYGYTFPTRVATLPRKRHEICWVIRKADINLHRDLQKRFWEPV